VVLRSLLTLEGKLVLALLVVVDKDDIPQTKFLGIHEFQKFQKFHAKSISERMLSILYELSISKVYEFYEF